MNFLFTCMQEQNVRRYDRQMINQVRTIAWTCGIPCNFFVILIMWKPQQTLLQKRIHTLLLRQLSRLPFLLLINLQKTQHKITTQKQNKTHSNPTTINLKKPTLVNTNTCSSAAEHPLKSSLRASAISAGDLAFFAALNQTVGRH